MLTAPDLGWKNDFERDSAAAILAKREADKYATLIMAFSGRMRSNLTNGRNRMVEVDEAWSEDKIMPRRGF